MNCADSDCTSAHPTNSDCLPKQKKPLPSLCWRTKLGIVGRLMSLPRPALSGQRYWERSRMRELHAAGPEPRTAMAACVRVLCVGAPPFAVFEGWVRACIRTALTLSVLFSFLPLLSCSGKPDPNALVMIIESSPTNLDPRGGLDANSERIDSLLFDDLLTRDQHLSVAPGLAERWEIPDPKTYVFHLHHGVKFHDGHPLTSRDVKWTFDSLLQGKIRSTKAAAYQFVDRIDAPDDYTVIFHLKQPFATLLWNLSDGAIGIVPFSSGAEITDHPMGSGPFRFVSAQQDKEVIIERNDDYWGQKSKVKTVRFMVVPDTTTRALELRKGSADVAINALTPDMVLTLERESKLEVVRAPGTVLQYMAFNLRDPVLKDVRIRQALALAIDRRPILEYLWRGFAQPAASILPVQSWAYTSHVATYSYDPQRARQLLDAAGYPAGKSARFHLT